MTSESGEIKEYGREERGRSSLFWVVNSFVSNLCPNVPEFAHPELAFKLSTDSATPPTFPIIQIALRPPF